MKDTHPWPEYGDDYNQVGNKGQETGRDQAAYRPHWPLAI